MLLVILGILLTLQKMFTKIIFSGVGAGAGFRKKIPGAGAASKQAGSETLIAPSSGTKIYRLKNRPRVYLPTHWADNWNLVVYVRVCGTVFAHSVPWDKQACFGQPSLRISFLYNTGKKYYYWTSPLMNTGLYLCMLSLVTARLSRHRRFVS